MIEITPSIAIDENEIICTAIRSQGAGGQNVNKVSSAIHLRFNIAHSSLPEALKQLLLALNDTRITKDGEIIIKAQQYRTQEKNKAEAIKRLIALILPLTRTIKERRATKPTKRSQQKRLESKLLRGKTKQLRQRISY